MHTWFSSPTPPLPRPSHRQLPMCLFWRFYMKSGTILYTAFCIWLFPLGGMLLQYICSAHVSVVASFFIAERHFTEWRYPIIVLYYCYTIIIINNLLVNVIDPIFKIDQICSLMLICETVNYAFPKLKKYLYPNEHTVREHFLNTTVNYSHLSRMPLFICFAVENEP